MGTDVLTLGDRLNFFEHYGPLAQSGQKKYGVPASVTLAQAALESGYGQHDLGVYNFFGIKARLGELSVSRMTTEFIGGQRQSVMANFRAYASAEEAFDDHARLLSSR